MTDEELQALITLMSLKHAGPRRLRALLAVASGIEVVDALQRQHRPVATADPSIESVSIAPAVWEGWFGEIRAKSAAVDLDAHRSDGGQVLYPGHEAWPFSADPDPPILAFVKGAVDLFERRPSVAIVGTRRCTSAGRSVADAIGRDLAESGVTVVSGLALGVDAAAHRGALSVAGPVVGVVASGLDVVYPASNRTLWEAVAADGVLLSEVPMGQRPTKWRFPARNRLIAALSDAVVVVESHARGGALSTVDEANERGVSVLVVPGSTRSPASDGTNALLVDGATPVRGAADILDFLGFRSSPRLGQATPPTQLVIPLGDRSGRRQLVLDAVAAGPVHIDRLIELLGVSPPLAAATIDELASDGFVVMRGHVIERVELTR